MVWNDYASLVAFVFPVVIFGMMLAIRVFGSIPDLRRGRWWGAEKLPFFLILGLTALIIGAIVIVWRYRRADAFFQHGVEVPGIISSRWKFRDRGRISYRYAYGNHQYIASAPVHYSRTVQDLVEGTDVHVFVNPDDPRRSLLKELYA